MVNRMLALLVTCRSLWMNLCVQLCRYWKGGRIIIAWVLRWRVVLWVCSNPFYGLAFYMCRASSRYGVRTVRTGIVQRLWSCRRVPGLRSMGLDTITILMLLQLSCVVSLNVADADLGNIDDADSVMWVLSICDVSGWRILRYFILWLSW